MKTIIHFLPKFIFFLLLSIGFYSVAYSQNSYQYECVSVSNDGNAIINIWNPKKGKNYKLEQARKDAINAILYSGIPSNSICLSQKPILQKQEEQSKFQKIEKEFFKTNGVWSTYTRLSKTETTIPNNLGSKKWKVYQVSVAKDLLRKYLEEKNILKPLNEGF